MGEEFGYMILESKKQRREFKTRSDIGSTGGLLRTVAKRKGFPRRTRWQKYLN